MVEDHYRLKRLEKALASGHVFFAQENANLPRKHAQNDAFGHPRDGTHTGHTCAQGHTESRITQTNLTTMFEPSLQPTNAPTRHKHDRTTTETAADSTAAARSRPHPAADSEKAAPSEFTFS